MLSNNDRILIKIKERMERGKETYFEDVPLDGEGDNRDNTKELLEEILDAMVYAAAAILSIEKRKSKFRKHTSHDGIVTMYTLDKGEDNV